LFCEGGVPVQSCWRFGASGLSGVVCDRIPVRSRR